MSGGALEGGVTHSHDTSASVSIATVTAEQYLAKMGAFFTQLHIIGASLSEPHTSGTALRKCVNVRACLRPYAVNFK